MPPTVGEPGEFFYAYAPTVLLRPCITLPLYYAFGWIVYSRFAELLGGSILATHYYDV